MARFEAALAAASAACGLIPAESARTIEQVSARAQFDAAQLAHEARHAGSLAIPFVKALRAQVAAASADAARYVHFGATSQDVIDSAVVLCLRVANERLLSLAVELGNGAAGLARQHSATPTVARTLLQPAAPVPFGWKAAMWLAPLARSLPRFRSAASEACVLQLGGAAGTLSAFESQGQEIARAVANRLALPYVVTWHSARDAFARLGAEMAILAGIAGKIARDVSLLMQPEVGEAAEPAAAGRGGSSAMPHKRNPSMSLLALEAAQRTPGLAATLLAQLGAEHERGLGQWQSQWFVLRELACGSASALGAMAEALRGLEVDAAAMRANLERSKGLVFSEAVARRLSRAAADRLCEQAIRESRHLAEVMHGDAEVAAELSADEIARLFEPQNAFGSAPGMLERVLADWRAAQSSGSPT